MRTGVSEEVRENVQKLCRGRALVECVSLYFRENNQYFYFMMAISEGSRFRVL